MDHGIYLLAALFVLLVPFHSVHQMMSNCTNKSRNREAYWFEFEKKFGQAISNFIRTEFIKLFGIKNVQKSTETLKDLKQEVYLKLLENDCGALKNFKGSNESSFLGYLYTISVNVVRNYFKAQKTLKRDIDKQYRWDTKLPCRMSVCVSIMSELEYKFLIEQIYYFLKKVYRNKYAERNLLISRIRKLIALKLR